MMTMTTTTTMMEKKKPETTEQLREIVNKTQKSLLVRHNQKFPAKDMTDNLEGENVEPAESENCLELDTMSNCDTLLESKDEMLLLQQSQQDRETSHSGLAESNEQKSEASEPLIPAQGNAADVTEDNTETLPIHDSSVKAENDAETESVKILEFHGSDKDEKRSPHKAHRGHRCDQCNKTFRYRTTLVMHLRIHQGEPPHQCSRCGEGIQLEVTAQNSQQQVP